MLKFNWLINNNGRESSTFTLQFRLYFTSHTHKQRTSFFHFIWLFACSRRRLYFAVDALLGVIVYWPLTIEFQNYMLLLSTFFSSFMYELLKSIRKEVELEKESTKWRQTSEIEVNYNVFGTMNALVLKHIGNCVTRLLKRKVYFTCLNDEEKKWWAQAKLKNEFCFKSSHFIFNHDIYFFILLHNKINFISVSC